jgi:hypothetical protein
MGLHVQKHLALTGFDNVFRLTNIACIQSHLLNKDKAITNKKVGTAQFSLTSQ